MPGILVRLFLAGRRLVKDTYMFAVETGEILPSSSRSLTLGKPCHMYKRHLLRLKRAR